MNLYLVQHGEAMTKDLDPERPLSNRGRQDVTKTAQFIAKNCRLNISHIHHSGKLRARQTADILATGLDLPEPIEINGLAPLDEPSIWTCRLEELLDSVMLVGHLPHLGRLTGALLCGKPETAPVRFQMGGGVALVKQDGQWSLEWMLVPGMLAG